MKNLLQHRFCGVIPPHILNRIASRCAPELSTRALATLDQMREIIAARGVLPEVPQGATAVPRKNRRVYDAKHRRQAPGQLVMMEHWPRVADVEVNEAFDGAGTTYDFYATVFGRSSVDGKGKRLDSTVHYGTRFDNALWDGRQMIYGDGDGRLFKRFTASLDVIGHEITHGHTQYLCNLGYSGQTGAINEHISDAFGSMVKQWARSQTAGQADWLIGAELFGPGVAARGIRSLAAPGTAYDDPVLGKDPQPAHMRDYVVTQDDNGGVHINSGIPNHAFYILATTLGGYTWQVAGRIWFLTVRDHLKSDANFNDFARATVEVAGEQYGDGGQVQQTVAQAWALVGIGVPLSGKPVSSGSPQPTLQPSANADYQLPAAA
jgi:Zn-dependent metalloprotease